MGPLKKTKRTAGQLFREFWPQLVISVCWAFYRVAHSSSDLVTVFISNFSVSFFLTSWLWGQVVRVRRQQKVEDEFQNVRAGLQKLLESLQLQTQHLIGHTTGGDSFGYFVPMFFDRNELQLGFQNDSKYPVFDVFAEWIDLDEPTDIPKGKLWTRHRINLGAIYPSRIAMGAVKFDMRGRDRLRINVFIFARNGGLTQEFHVVRVDDWWKVAVRTRSEKFNQTNVPIDFPDYDKENPEKVFEGQ